MKLFFYCCSIVTILLGTSFLFADEADDFFSLDEKSTPPSSDTDSSSPNMTKESQKSQKNPAKKSPKKTPKKSTPQAETQSVIFDSLKGKKLNSADAYKTLIGLRNTNPTSIEPDFTMGLLFVFAKKDFQHAIEHFLACQEKRPEDTKVLINLGTIYLLNENYSEGFVCYFKAYQLGTHSTVMSHNLYKFLQQAQQKNIKLPVASKKKFVNFAQEVFKQTPPPRLNGPKGWMFEPCSDGYSKEGSKKSWFQLGSYGCYEFPICMACKGKGKVDCPNPQCSSGKVGKMVTKTYVTPSKEHVKMQVRQKVNCDVCNGYSHVTCPQCQGKGLEYVPAGSEQDSFDN